jgi:phosphatidylglycerophosphatase A
MGPGDSRRDHPMAIPLGQRACLFIATGGYVGYLPGAPGTAGSFLGLGLSWLSASYSPNVQIGFLLVLFLLGVVTAGSAERWYGIKDHGSIIIDEIVGMALALAMLPFQTGYVIPAFILFRFFDIIKPIASLERLPGGWGIMCDDAFAAILTNIILQGIRLLLA